MKVVLDKLVKNNNEILQYYDKNNDIALIGNALACITPNAWCLTIYYYTTPMLIIMSKSC